MPIGARATARRGAPTRRKKVPGLAAALIALVEDEVAGDPCTRRRWIRRSLTKLQRALARAGYRVSRATIRRLLQDRGIRPKTNVKRLAPRQHVDRDRQFRYIRAQRRRFATHGWPVLSVDCKKKELIGPFKYPGRVWCRTAPAVYATDFPGDALCKATPYGIYDVGANTGHVYVGTQGESTDMAVAALAHWWRHIGRHRYPTARQVLILADGGGSNGSRVRRWKQQLQVRLADPLGLTLTVCHYPPGASKWNPIEHRLFSQISQTWAGTPLMSLQVLLEGIRRTKTATGLQVTATLFTRRFPKGVKVTAREMASLAITKHVTCPQWNYTIEPHLSGK